MPLYQGSNMLDQLLSPCNPGLSLVSVEAGIVKTVHTGGPTAGVGEHAGIFQGLACPLQAVSHTTSSRASITTLPPRFLRVAKTAWHGSAGYTTPGDCARRRIRLPHSPIQSRTIGGESHLRVPHSWLHQLAQENPNPIRIRPPGERATRTG